ncbi:MAG: radical SAM family heme chaperone HemW [bacterium]|nr:radical SAM family heme chaperone HemW [bacterium]
MGRKDLGVYVHVPFCERVCPYCDFAVVARRVLEPAEEQRTVAALRKELRARAPAYPGHDLATIYFGGGTPALLQPASIAGLIGDIQKHWNDGSEPREVTLELNPSTLERERLPAFRDAGVDRLSIGVQSFDDGSLHRLGRAHRVEEVHRTLEAARAAGFANLSLDLIFGVPGQDLASVQHDVREALAYRPEHVSAYGLTVEEGTPYATAVARGQFHPPDDETAAAMMEAVAASLGAGGLERYEISNYARPGYEARHNRRYWRREPVLGVGVGAHSSESAGPRAPHGAHRANERDLAAWLDRVESGGAATPPEVDLLDERAARAEAGFLALRTRAGLDRLRFEAEFGLSPEACWPVLEQLEEAGLLEQAGEAWRLTQSGWLLSDTVFERLV